MNLDSLPCPFALAFLESSPFVFVGTEDVDFSLRGVVGRILGFLAEVGVEGSTCFLFFFLLFFQAFATLAFIGG